MYGSYILQSKEGAVVLFAEIDEQQEIVKFIFKDEDYNKGVQKVLMHIFNASENEVDEAPEDNEDGLITKFFYVIDSEHLTAVVKSMKKMMSELNLSSHYNFSPN